LDRFRLEEARVPRVAESKQSCRTTSNLGTTRLKQLTASRAGAGTFCCSGSTAGATEP
jgi:hypothetical protein